MLKFSEIFEFSKEKFRKIPILKEFEWFEWFEWFGPSPIEPFNSGRGRDTERERQALREGGLRRFDVRRREELLDLRGVHREGHAPLDLCLRR